MTITKTCDSVSAPTFDTDSRARPLREATNRSDEATRQRIPNKTQWALGDMLHHAKEGREDMQMMLEWIERERVDAKGRYDTARLARLGELSHIVAGVALHVGELERLAGDALRGVYEPRSAGARRKATSHAKQ